MSLGNRLELDDWSVAPICTCSYHGNLDFVMLGFEATTGGCEIGKTWIILCRNSTATSSQNWIRIAPGKQNPAGARSILIVHFQISRNNLTRVFYIGRFMLFFFTHQIDQGFPKAWQHRIYVDRWNNVYNCKTIYSDITSGMLESQKKGVEQRHRLRTFSSSCVCTYRRLIHRSHSKLRWKFVRWTSRLL